jgi:hypothetical protein
MDPKYPLIDVQLTGQDSNAFMIIGLVMKALRKAGVPKAEIDEFGKEATSGDYGNVIATAMRWVTVS